MEAAVEPDPPVLVPGGPLFQTLPAEGGGVGTEEIPPSAGLTNKKIFLSFSWDQCCCVVKNSNIEPSKVFAMK